MVILVVCVVVGLLSGHAVSQVLGRSRGGPLLNHLVGVAGALIAGCLLILRVGASPAGDVVFWSGIVGSGYPSRRTASGDSWISSRSWLSRFMQ